MSWFAMHKSARLLTVSGLLLISLFVPPASGSHDVSVHAGDSEGWVDEWIADHVVTLTNKHIQTSPETTEIDVITYARYEWDITEFLEICPDTDPDIKCFANSSGWLSMENQDTWVHENEIEPSGEDRFVSWPRPSPFHNEWGGGSTKYESQWDSIIAHDREMAAHGTVEIPIGEIVVEEYDLRASANGKFDGILHAGSGETVETGAFTVGHDPQIGCTLGCPHVV